MPALAVVDTVELTCAAGPAKTVKIAVAETLPASAVMWTSPAAVADTRRAPGSAIQVAAPQSASTIAATEFAKASTAWTAMVHVAPASHVADWRLNKTGGPE